jgi:hypothetical protein
MLRFHRRWIAVGGVGSWIVRVQLAAVAAIFVVSSHAQALIVLTSGNSTAAVDPFTQNGMDHWDIQGINQLQQQWFWYGIGNGPVQSIDTISLPTITTMGSNQLVTTYTNPGVLSVSIDYTLTGGAVQPAGQVADADMGEAITLTNLSGSNLPLHFYEYSYFNLNGASNDTVQLGTNLQGKYDDAYQTDGSTALTETVVTPGANEGEVAPVGLTLAKLNSGGPVTLGPPFGAGPVGPGAVTWAFQWDFAIAPGGSPIISKDKSLSVLIPVPEPASLCGLGIAGGLCMLRRRKRSI